MSFQRLQQGDEYPATVLATNSTGAASNPDAAPTVDFYNSAGSNILSGQSMAPIDLSNATGLFQRRVRLGQPFPAGSYSAVYSWSIGAFTGRTSEMFEVLAGGNEDGSVVSMHFFNRPHASFVVYQTDAGKLRSGRNPRAE